VQVEHEFRCRLARNSSILTNSSRAAAAVELVLLRKSESFSLVDAYSVVVHVIVQQK
jgi:hypothetical protein